jgi:hypothetical protein
MACTSQLPNDDRVTRCCAASNRIASRRAVGTKIGTGMRRNPPAGARKGGLTRAHVRVGVDPEDRQVIAVLVDEV